jgi:hypothetical protein
MSNSRRSAYSLSVAFLAAAIAAFLGMRWNMLETQWAFPIGTKLMLIAAVAAAAFSRALGRTQQKATILTVGAAVPAGAFLNMVVEMLRDPTSGNLWPIAVAVLAVFSLAASLLGTLLGSLVLRLFNGTGR